MKLLGRLKENKKDRNIALVFAALILYVLAELLWDLCVNSIFGVDLQGFMMMFFPDKMTYANYPGSYGNLFVMAVGLTVIGAVWQAVWKKNWKRVLAAAGMGCLVSLGVLGAFHLHCRLIVSTGADQSAFRGTVYCHTKGSYMNLDLDANEEASRELARLCYQLEPYGRAEQRELNQAYREEDLDEIHIWLIYPEKYGHTFWLSVRVAEEYIFIEQSGRQGAEYTFYRDNGLLEELKALTKLDVLHE